MRQHKKPIACPAIPTLQLRWLAAPALLACYCKDARTAGTQE